MKLESFILSMGSACQVREFVAEILFPHVVHDEDMAHIVEKLCESQGRMPLPAKFSVSMWDIAWPDRAWTFCHKFRLYNKPSNDPVTTKYIDPVVQISIGRNSADLLSVLVYHRLLHPIIK